LGVAFGTKKSPNNLSGLILQKLFYIKFSQTNKISERVKYVTNAPDGTVSFTIIDDSREYSMKLESVDAFYKYQILDTKTAEAVYEVENVGKACIIDKSKNSSRHL